MNNVLDLIKQSFIIMILGMVIVFIFIEIMIFFINLAHIVINKKNKVFNSTEESKKTDNYSKKQDKINKINRKAIINKDEESNDFENEDQKNICGKATFDEKIISAVFTAVKLYENSK